MSRLNDEPTDGLAAVTMALECMTILCNPDVALDMRASLEQRCNDDVPGVGELAAAVAALLACLPSLGGGLSSAYEAAGAQMWVG